MRSRYRQSWASRVSAVHMAFRIARWSALARLRRLVSDADSSLPSRSSTSASTAIGSRGSGRAGPGSAGAGGCSWRLCWARS